MRLKKTNLFPWVKHTRVWLQPSRQKPEAVQDFGKFMKVSHVVGPLADLYIPHSCELHATQVGAAEMVALTNTANLQDSASGTFRRGLYYISSLIPNVDAIFILNFL